MILAGLQNNFLDYIFPAFCLGCAEEGSWLCGACESKIVRVKTQVCPDCDKISPVGAYCLRCRKKEQRKLDGIITAAYYEEGPIKELIHNLKYNQMTNLTPILSRLMADALAENFPVSKTKVLITSVPMWRWRKARRGYNQAELLAKEIAKLSSENLELNCNILKKIKKTVAQVKKGGQKRRENLQNSFAINPHFSIRGRTIILVDDVATTGTTLNECAKVLKASGAKKVWGLVLARG